ncbi:hypothetical protein HMI54_006309 [Coelomomyces lativittatus]|nr:hypothetical protein HMI54_006309 [Coelomomyces lativittatus]
MGTLQKMDPNQGCLLSLVQSMCQELSSALIQQFPSVLTPVQGWVKNIFFNSSTSMYECETYPGVIDTFQGLPSLSNLLPPPMSISTSKLILCTGSEPRVPPTLSSLSSRWIPLEVCLTPSLLRQEFSKTQPPRTIHVVGGSHSAVLCVKNLYDVLGDHNDQIYLDTRHPFVYAEEDPEGKGIRHDNRGLKLIAAEFAKLLERSQVPNVHVGRLSSSFTSSKTPMDAHVLAIGYQRRRTVHLFLDHHDVEFRHDPHLGHLEVVYPSMDPPPQRLPKAFGFGIAFPERIRDLSGDFEWNVGLWKFMNYIQRVLH